MIDYKSFQFITSLSLVAEIQSSCHEHWVYSSVSFMCVCVYVCARKIISWNKKNLSPFLINCPRHTWIFVHFYIHYIHNDKHTFVYYTYTTHTHKHIHSYYYTFSVYMMKACKAQSYSRACMHVYKVDEFALKI